MLLQDKLDALKAECLAKTPPKVTLVRQRAVEGLAGLAERAMHAVEQAPAFQLRDGYGGAFSSREALRQPDRPRVLQGEMVPLLQHRPPRDRGRLARQPRRFAGRRLAQTPDNSRET